MLLLLGPWKAVVVVGTVGKGFDGARDVGEDGVDLPEDEGSLVTGGLFLTTSSKLGLGFLEPGAGGLSRLTKSLILLPLLSL